MHHNTTFITGATGFIAFELLKNIIENEPTGDLYVLIRANKNHTALYRFNQLLEELRGQHGVKNCPDLSNRIHLIEGDITVQRFGMDLEAYTKLSQKIHRIYHIAASVHLTGALDKMRNINVAGTKTVLDFALEVQKNNTLQLVNYVSTAYVAGKRAGIIYENELTKNQSFNNNYENAKYEAELLVQEYAQKLPIAIYRPSIVMGNSKTGWTKTFNVLYEPMKLVYFGLLKIAPADYNSIVDIVPVDYVAQGIYHISRQREKAISQTFHLTIGQGKSESFPIVIKKIITNLFYWADHYQLKNPKKMPRLIKPVFFKYLAKCTAVFSSKKQKRKIKQMLTYTDYVSITKEFDTTNTEAILKPMGITCPTLEEYMDELCHYAVKKHFGKSHKPEHVFTKQTHSNSTYKGLKNASASSS